MPIVFDEVVGSVAPGEGERGSSRGSTSPDSTGESVLERRERLIRELKIREERQARLFAD